MHPGSRPELHINFFWLSLCRLATVNMWAITNPCCSKDGRIEKGQMAEVRITPRKGMPPPPSHKQPGKHILNPPLHTEPHKHNVMCLDSTCYQQGWFSSTLRGVFSNPFQNRLASSLAWLEKALNWGSSLYFEARLQQLVFHGGERLIS